MRYLPRMPRLVTYAIGDREDGLFDVTATIAPDKVFRRQGLATRAEAEEWVEGLRVLMAALGAPVARAEPEAELPVRDPAWARRGAG